MRVFGWLIVMSLFVLSRFMWLVRCFIFVMEWLVRNIVVLLVVRFLMSFYSDWWFVGLMLVVGLFKNSMLGLLMSVSVM